MGMITHVKLTAIVGKVSQNDTQIHKTREDTSTQSSNRCRGLAGQSCREHMKYTSTHDFSKVYRANNDSLSNPQSSDKSSSIHSS